jgi:hypothetical protein
MGENTKLWSALALAELGFFVFRLKRNGKTPFATGWQQEATRDPDKITELFNNHDFNIGCLTENYGDNQALVVVDVDTKPGKQGANTFSDLEAFGNDFPQTWEATTASGGRHLFYTYPMPLSGGANKLGLHIDIKSYGGYVVGVGSTIDGNTYSWTWDGRTQPLAPTPCPDWIRAKLTRPLARDTSTPAIENLDSPDIIARATTYLQSAPPAIEGAGGNETTLKTALKLKDYGISQPLAEELIFDIYNPRCSPPWDFDQLIQVIENAYRYGKLPPGVSSPAADFDPISPTDLPTPPGQVKKQGLYAEHIRDITIPVNQKSLIKGLLDPEAMSVLYGESNTGKTFIAMDIAYHIAAGISYNGRPTEQGSVFYVAAEAGRSAKSRVVALRQRLGDPSDPSTPFFLIPCPIDLYRSNADVDELTSLITSTLAAHPGAPPPALIVIDTLARAMAGGNENAFEDMSEFIKKIGVIQQRTRAHVMIVHHSGKDTAKGARGHSSLRAATDTELEVADGTVTSRKQRDMEVTQPFGFILETVELGFDAYNEKITSCVVKKTEAAITTNTRVRGLKMTPRDLVVYLALKECKTGRALRGYENVVDTKEWAQCCKDYNMSLVPDAKNWPVTANSFIVMFKRSRDKLVTMELVEEIAKDQWVITKS